MASGRSLMEAALLANDLDAVTLAAEAALEFGPEDALETLEELVVLPVEAAEGALALLGRLARAAGDGGDAAAAAAVEAVGNSEDTHPRDGLAAILSLLAQEQPDHDGDDGADGDLPELVAAAVHAASVLLHRVRPSQRREAAKQAAPLIARAVVAARPDEETYEPEEAGRIAAKLFNAGAAFVLQAARAGARHAATRCWAVFAGTAVLDGHIDDGLAALLDNDDLLRALGHTVASLADRALGDPFPDREEEECVEARMDCTDESRLEQEEEPEYEYRVDGSSVERFGAAALVAGLVSMDRAVLDSYGQDELDTALVRAWRVGRILLSECFFGAFLGISLTNSACATASERHAVSGEVIEGAAQDLLYELVRRMSYPGSEALQSQALNSLRCVLSVLAPCSRWTVLRATVARFQKQLRVFHPEGAGLATLLRCLKDEVTKGWPPRGCFESASPFVGPAVPELLREVLQTALAKATPSPDHFESAADVLVGAMNVYRFLLMRERAHGSNLTGVLDSGALSRFREEILVPVVRCATENRAHGPGEGEVGVLAASSVEEVASRALEVVDAELAL